MADKNISNILKYMKGDDDSVSGLPQVEEDIVDIATQKGHNTDADGEHGAKAEAVAVIVVEHGECDLTVASPVTLAAVA